MIEGLVSIVTPLFNGGKYIHETIESVINQTYSNWEMLIINDGSTDNSAKIAEQFTIKDSRIKLFGQSNAGSAAARNNGLRRANGQYIALLDADDLWDPIFLEEQIRFLKSKNAVLVFASHRRIDDRSVECLQPFIVPDKITYNDLLQTCSVSCLTALYDVSRFGKFYLNEALGSYRDDYVLWLTIIKKAGVFYGNKKILASYRMLQGSATRNKKKIIIPQFMVYYKNEKMSFLKSIYYSLHWAIRGYAKYRK
jgi:teichuronic acid biosynthesis glycosyltransferase TuaG